jgi:hypothetical protein
MIWFVTLEILAASFAMGLWASNLARRQTSVGFLWVCVCILIVYHLSSKLKLY